MSYQLGDKPPGTLTVGQNVLLPRGVSHKPRNVGTEELIVEGWVQPANNFVFFLTTLFESMKGQTKPQPSPFDGAFLIMRYASEYTLTEIPFFVRKVIIPLTYLVGKLSGKYKKYKNAPEPIWMNMRTKHFQRITHKMIAHFQRFNLLVSYYQIHVIPGCAFILH